MAGSFFILPSASAIGAQPVSEKDQPNGYAGLNASGEIVGTIIVRQDTDANLAAVVLAAGEPAFASDSGLLKVGDGATAFDSLPWCGTDKINPQTGQLFDSSGVVSVEFDTARSLHNNTGDATVNFQGCNLRDPATSSPTVLWVACQLMNANATVLDWSEDANLQAPLRLTETPSTPANPAQNTECKVYMKGDKFVIQFNNAGTVRYKYLDLTGTGVTWVHTTVAP